MVHIKTISTIHVNGKQMKECESIPFDPPCSVATRSNSQTTSAAEGRFQLQRQRTQFQIPEPRLRVELFTPVMYLVP